MTVSNYQASLVLNQEIVFQGVFPSRENPGGEHVVPIAAIRTNAFNSDVLGGGDAAGGIL